MYNGFPHHHDHIIPLKNLSRTWFYIFLNFYFLCNKNYEIQIIKLNEIKN